MNIAFHDGRLRYLRKDGSPSDRRVSKLAALRFLGFPLGWCGRERDGPHAVDILEGDIYSDEVLLVRAQGASWYRDARISRSGMVQVLRDWSKARGLTEFPPMPPTRTRDLDARIADQFIARYVYECRKCGALVYRADYVPDGRNPRAAPCPNCGEYLRFVSKLREPLTFFRLAADVKSRGARIGYYAASKAIHAVSPKSQ
jgi:DNA-directed RNA polymerase subunit RPC12/RpoP